MDAQGLRERKKRETRIALSWATIRLVVERGTGTAVTPHIRGTGWTMGGKTGTAEVANRPDNGWFAGLILDPERQPRYTVVAFLLGGGPGGRLPAGIGAGMTRFFATGGRDAGQVAE